MRSVLPTAKTGKSGRRPNYGSKRRINTHGYVELYEPDHPLAWACGYVLESRKVAWDAGLLTDPTNHVHHAPRGQLDNRLENLSVLTPAEHARHHHLHEQETYDRMRTLRPRGREHWDCLVHGLVAHSRIAAPPHVASSGEAP